MKSLDLLQPAVARRPPCKVKVALGLVGSDERATVEKALDLGSGVSHSALVQFFLENREQFGSVGKDAIRNHRYGRCDCER